MHYHQQIPLIQESNIESPLTQEYEEESTVDEKTQEELNEITTDQRKKDDLVLNESSQYLAQVIRRGPFIYISELRVRILDQKQNPVTDILVKLFSEPKEAYTNNLGIVTFREVKVGEHTISFNYKGKEYEESISIERPDIDQEVLVLEIVEITVAEENNYNYLYFLLIIPFLFLTYRIYKKKKTSEVV